ncbi:hypothetical protein PCI56_14610 [Plesiomonas shigelloides subsp. oncorhynchi]|nr:hypothetical protein [Plesiomonas shigelloides]
MSKDIQLEIRNLCVDYITDAGDVRAVNNVSFDIKKARSSVWPVNPVAVKVPSPSRPCACTNRLHLSLAERSCSMVRTF